MPFFDKINRYCGACGLKRDCGATLCGVVYARHYPNVPSATAPCHLPPALARVPSTRDTPGHGTKVQSPPLHAPLLGLMWCGSLFLLHSVVRALS